MVTELVFTKINKSLKIKFYEKSASNVGYEKYVKPTEGEEKREFDIEKLRE